MYILTYVRFMNERIPKKEIKENTRLLTMMAQLCRLELD